MHNYIEFSYSGGITRKVLAPGLISFIKLLGYNTFLNVELKFGKWVYQMGQMDGPKYAK